MFHAAKDALTSRAVRMRVNHLIARYGSVLHLKIDSRGKTLEVSCLLHGESAPVTIRVEGYVVDTEQDKKYLRGTTFHSSRPWLQTLLTDFGPRKRIELPAWATVLL